MVNGTRYTVEERGRGWRGTSISVRQAEWEGRPVGLGVFWLLFYIYALGFVYRVLVLFMLEFCWSVLAGFGLFCFGLFWFGWLVGCVMVPSTCVRSTFFLLRKLAGVCASDQTWRFSPIVPACPWEGVYFPFENSCSTVVMDHGLRQIRLRCRHQAPRSSCESCYIYSTRCVGASNMVRCCLSALPLTVRRTCRFNAIPRIVE